MSAQTQPLPELPREPIEEPIHPLRLVEEGETVETQQLDTVIHPAEEEVGGRKDGADHAERDAFKSQNLPNIVKTDSENRAWETSTNAILKDEEMGPESLERILYERKEKLFPPEEQQKV